jgi:hypothetical protein
MSDETNKELSPEEVKARRAEITKFYKEQIPHLKVQAEYERLMTEIEENRAKRAQAQGFLAEVYMNMKEDLEKSTQESTGDPKEDFESRVPPPPQETKRKLKKVNTDE